MCSTVRHLRAFQRLSECLTRAKTNRDMFGHLYARVHGYVSACWLTVARVWRKLVSVCACVYVCVRARVVTPQSPWPCAVARRQSAIRKSSPQREPDHFQRHLYLHGVQFADLSRIKGRHTRRWGRERREAGREDDPYTPHTHILIFILSKSVPRSHLKTHMSSVSLRLILVAIPFCTLVGKWTCDLCPPRPHQHTWCLTTHACSHTTVCYTCVSHWTHHAAYLSFK